MPETKHLFSNVNPMHQIVECVPNFSEGRRPDVIAAIAAAIRAVPGTHVLDVSSDPDHNRTVITFVGTPQAVEEGAFQAIATARTLINLDAHSGEHPRIGATDVVPFIPIKNVTSADCKAIATRLGERVGRDLDVAVYYYGLAATRPERTLLADIRKGEYEGWKAEIGRNPDRDPDAGPATPAPWGATVIGVRQFLVAYNIYLTTDNVGIAEAVAKAVRNLDGGFRYLQGKGFLVEGQAQVSMNFQHFERTPLHRVTEAVRREAQRYGVNIARAELVGLIPQQALLDAAAWYLQLDLDPDQVLELRLQAAPDSADNPDDFIARVAASTPTPGGGSVAALAGALGAALVEMVSGLTVGRKKYREVQEQAAAALSRATALRRELGEAVSADSAAFEQVLAVSRQLWPTAADKAQALQQATIHAAEVPLGVCRLARDVLHLARELVQIGNPNAVTDAAAAGYMAHAALQIAAMNVRINATSLTDGARVQAWREELDALATESADLLAQIARISAERGNF
jgi:glutamate formiminotransferase/formiminotetrahydrofolate cyclodeaminase